MGSARERLAKVIEEAVRQHFAGREELPRDWRVSSFEAAADAVLVAFPQLDDKYHDQPDGSF